jgi:GAF domain-containing protein
VVTVDVVAPSEPPDDAATGTATHSVVAAVTQSMLAGEPVATVLDTAVRGIGRALDASHVSFVEVRKPGGELEVLASTVDEPAQTFPATEPFGSHVGFALQSLRPIVVRDFEAERRFDRGPFAGEQAARSGLCVPVRWGADGVGALSVHSPDARPELGAVEVTFVQAAANVCALALQGKDGVTNEERT